MGKKNLPEEGELVQATISKIEKHCAWATLDEYDDHRGMIHISEVASSWVRNIRNFIHEGQHSVCRVMNADPKTGHVNLSIKRVTDAEKRRKMESVRKSRRATKLLEFASKKMGVDFEKAMSTVGKKLKDEFGDLNTALEHAARGNDLPVKNEWNKVLKKIAEENVTFPTYEIIRFLKIHSDASDGVEKVKKVLQKLEEEGTEIQYISAPKYKITLTGEDRKKTAIKLEDLCEKAINQIEEYEGGGELIT